jgi:hypothetical protein
MAAKIPRNPCDTVAHFVIQVMGARYKARSVSELDDRAYVIPELSSLKPVPL